VTTALQRTGPKMMNPVAERVTAGLVIRSGEGPPASHSPSVPGFAARYLETVYDGNSADCRNRYAHDPVNGTTSKSA